MLLLGRPGGILKAPEGGFHTGLQCGSTFLRTDPKLPPLVSPSASLEDSGRSECIEEESWGQLSLTARSMSRNTAPLDNDGASAGERAPFQGSEAGHISSVHFPELSELLSFNPGPPRQRNLSLTVPPTGSGPPLHSPATPHSQLSALLQGRLEPSNPPTPQAPLQQGGTFNPGLMRLALENLPPQQTATTPTPQPSPLSVFLQNSLQQQQQQERGALDRLLAAEGGMPWELLPGGTAEETRRMLVQQAQYWQAEAAVYVEKQVQACQLQQLQAVLQQQAQPGADTSSQLAHLAAALTARSRPGLASTQAAGLPPPLTSIIPPTLSPTQGTPVPPVPTFNVPPAVLQGASARVEAGVSWPMTLQRAAQTLPRAPTPSWQRGAGGSSGATTQAHSWQGGEVAGAESESTSESSGSKKRRREDEEVGTTRSEAAVVMPPPSRQPKPRVSSEQASPKEPPAAPTLPMLPPPTSTTRALLNTASPQPSAAASQAPAPSAGEAGAIVVPSDKTPVRLRARRGQATDPHSITERLRREKIAERMRTLQDLVPNSNKTDKASMLEEIIDYVKFLQLQVKILSVNRNVGDPPSPTQANSLPSVATLPAAPQEFSSAEERASVEREVSRLMETEMGSAMRYLLSKGLCLVPVNMAAPLTASLQQGEGASHSAQMRGGDTPSGSGPRAAGREPWRDSR